MTMRTPPESLAQAATFERVKGNALMFGLDDACAAQLAWAHESGTGGFASVRPPCPRCAPLVALLPVAKPNGWRTVQGAASQAPNWPKSCVSAGGVSSGTRNPPDTSESRMLRRSASVDEAFLDREGGV